MKRAVAKPEGSSKRRKETCTIKNVDLYKGEGLGVVFLVDNLSLAHCLCFIVFEGRKVSSEDFELLKVLGTGGDLTKCFAIDFY